MNYKVGGGFRAAELWGRAAWCFDGGDGGVRRRWRGGCYGPKPVTERVGAFYLLSLTNNKEAQSVFLVLHPNLHRSHSPSLHPSLTPSLSPALPSSLSPPNAPFLSPYPSLSSSHTSTDLPLSKCLLRCSLFPKSE